MATNKTLFDVFERARYNLNDRPGTFWKDINLLGHVQNAYSWMFSNISVLVDKPFEKIATLTYTANTEDLLSILPADLYVPILLEFRKNTNEEWKDVNRVDRLRSRETQTNDRVIEWEWRLRTILVNKATNGGLLRLRYSSLLTDLALETDPILMDNVVEALAYYTASDAFDSRGQEKMASKNLAKADHFLGLVKDKLILNEQMIPRRGQRYSTQARDLRPTKSS